MMIVTSSLHTTEELPTELELRIECQQAAAAELKALEELHYDPTSRALRRNLMSAAAAHDIAFSAWLALP